MEYVELSLTEIKALLIKKKIPFNTPGFYDHENFINEEKKDPKFLELYAAYINKRNYSDQYLAQAEQTIKEICTLFYNSIRNNRKLGACVDVSTVISRVLDKLGVWNCVIKGSLTISFPNGANLPQTHFWAIDTGDFTAPHAWVYAPPFNVIDLTIKYQHYQKNEADYLPNYFIGKSNERYHPQISDIYNPIIVKTNDKKLIENHLNQIIKFQKYIYSTGYTSDGTKLKFIPIATGISDVSLEKIQNIKFDNLYPYDFFKKNILHKIEPIKTR